MRSLSRRLQRLEAGCRRNEEVVADHCRCIRQSALEHLTVDELRSLIGAYKARQEGREYTSPELAALLAFNAAVNLECQKAGMTRAAFDRYQRADN
jgi:hypothetical protein